MRILARTVATIGQVALVTALLVWWSGRPDHSAGDAEVLATGLEIPWGLSFLPTGEALVGERNTGRIYRIPADGGERTLVGTVPGVVPDGEGGLLGLAVDPLYIQDSLVYAYFTAATDNRSSVSRSLLDESRSSPPSTSSPASPRRATTTAARSRSGPTGCSTPRSATPATRHAQDPATLNGKILRMDPTGDPPTEDNPDPGVARVLVGHRNPQGLAWDWRRPAVRRRVRPGHLGRVQPHRARRQLRLAV